MGGPLDGFGRALGRAPDRRVRLLVGAGPEIDVFEMVVLALEGERPLLGPGADDEVMRLVEAVMREGRVGAHRIVLAADAADHAADQPPARDAVDHRVLFGERQRMLADAEGRSDDGELDPRGASRQRRRGDDRRGHDAVGVLVVLVDAEPVEAELLAVFELVEIAVVEFVPLLGVEIAVGQNHPCRPVFLVVVEIEIGVGHQMKEKDLHRAHPVLWAGRL